MAVTLDPSIAMNNGTSSVYTDAYASIAAANQLSEQIENATTDDDTLQACKDFEAYMLEQMFKNMESTTKIFSDDDDEGDSTAKMYMENFKDTYYQDLVSQMMSSGNGIGIAEQLYESITNQKLGISSDTTTASQATSGADAVTAAASLAQSTGATAEQTAEEMALAAQSVAASAMASAT